MPAVLVWSGGERYALPQVHVREVVQLEPDEMLGSVDEVDGALVYRLRGRLLPLLVMAQHLGVTAAATPAGMTIVVVEIDGRRLGIVVDAVGDPIEAVVKPLTRATRSIPMFAGVTILSDGRPALIVDLDGLAAAGGLLRSAPTDPLPVEAPETATGTSVLLATVAGGEQLAVALGAVRRLEHFARGRVQHSRGGDVVEYADTILPLMRPAELVPVSGRRRAPARRNRRVRADDRLRLVDRSGGIGRGAHRRRRRGAPSMPRGRRRAHRW